MSVERSKHVTGSNPSLATSSVTERRPDGIITTKMFGKVTGAVVSRMHKDVAISIRPDSPKLWYVDTSRVTDIEAMTIMPPARILLKDLKEQDFSLVALITSSPVRLIGSTLCFGAGIRHRFVERELDADREISYFLKQGEFK